MYIAGSQATNSKFNSNRVSHSSICDPRGRATSATVSSPFPIGPAWVFIPGTGFTPCWNATESISSESTIFTIEQPDAVVWPRGLVELRQIDYGDSSQPDFITAAGASFNSGQGTVKYTDAVDDVPDYPIEPTPNGGAGLVQVWNCMVYNIDGFYGELEGVFWFSGSGAGAAAQDEIVIGTDRYLVFLAGTRTSESAFFAIKKA